ncbi:MAG: ATP-binding protein [Richelia sp. RM2_1_2]|nr:ATP-binding protein [Richelia sp. RM2_1_2]
MELVHEIFNLIKINNSPIIAVESPLQERRRFLINIVSEAKKHHRKCYLWSLDDDALIELDIDNNQNLLKQETSDYVPITEKRQKENYFSILKYWRNCPHTGIIIVEGLFPWIADTNHEATEFFLVSEWIKAALININLDNLHTGKTMLLLGANAQLSSYMAAEIPVVIQELPNHNEISDRIKFEIPGLSDADYSPIASAVMGLHIADINQCLAVATREVDIANPQAIEKNLFEQKIEMLQRLYSIEFVPPSLMTLGGYELMQETFHKYRRIATPLARAYKLSLPKGVLLVGPPGTGKSHSAKVCSQILGVPLIIVDWGSFRSYGNMASRQLKKLLALADRISQVILYFDDFDKGFAGGDDLAMRLAGKLLTWMQERTSQVLVFASVNRMETLPPELTRSGRFDDIFQCDLPNNGERHIIFKIHLAKFDSRFHNTESPYSKEEWRRIIKATNRCVGAEIQAIVEDAARSTFYEMMSEESLNNYDELPPLTINIDAILKAREMMNPLAIREADKVEAMRNRATLQAKPSSLVDKSEFALGNVSIYQE